MKNLPNIITISRIIASIIIPCLIMVDAPLFRLIALIIFILAAFTDWLDGYLARQLQAVSKMGRMLDPIADKALIALTLLALANIDDWGWLMFVPAILILFREVFISGLREYMSAYQLVIHVTMLAKFKTTFQLIALCLAIAAPLTPEFWHIQTLTIIMIWIAAFITVITGWNYFRIAMAHDSA